MTDICRPNASHDTTAGESTTKPAPGGGCTVTLLASDMCHGTDARVVHVLASQPDLTFGVSTIVRGRPPHPRDASANGEIGPA